MEKVYRYFVADCEHDGDLRNAAAEVETAGGVVTDVFWDGCDCGEAYVEFTIPSNKDKDTVLRKLHL